MIKTALRGWGLAGLVFFSLGATNAPAPVETNFIDPAITADNPATAQLNELIAKSRGDTNSASRGGFNVESMLNASFLFASLFWSSVAGGYLIYARKQRAIPPFLGGVAMMAVSMLVASWFWMSVSCLVLMVGIYFWMKQGD